MKKFRSTADAMINECLSHCASQKGKSDYWEIYMNNFKPIRSFVAMTGDIKYKILDTIQYNDK